MEGPDVRALELCARLSRIMHFEIQAIASSTTDGQCLVSYTEDNTQEINENNISLLRFVRKAKIMENTLPHECRNTGTVPMKSNILWNCVSWGLEARFF